MQMCYFNFGKTQMKTHFIKKKMLLYQFLHQTDLWTNFDWMIYMFAGMFLTSHTVPYISVNSVMNDNANLCVFMQLYLIIFSDVGLIWRVDSFHRWLTLEMLSWKVKWTWTHRPLVTFPPDSCLSYSMLLYLTVMFARI